MLDHFRRRQPARFRADLDLQGGVMDAEALRELLADVMQKGIVVTGGTDEMRRQRGFARAHGPDVEVVHLDDAFEAGEITLDRGELNASWHRVEREVDAVARKL